MKNQIKAIIFDMDGVLVDTAKYHYLSWKKLANGLEIDFDEEKNEELKGVNRIESLEKILSWANLNLNENTKTKLAFQKNEDYVSRINEMKPNEILPKIIDFLNWAKENQIKTAVGSASKNARLILERTNLLCFFDAIVDGNLVTLSKPNPQVFLKAAELLDITPENCLVIEDAIAGIEAAKNANMFVVGIGSKDQLNIADLVLNSTNELMEKGIDFLEKINKN